MIDEIWYNGRLLDVWEVSPEARTYSLLLLVNQGINPITLRAPAAPDPQSNRMISIVAFRVSVEYPELPKEKR